MSSDASKGPAAERLPRSYWTILEAISAVEPGTHVSAQDVFLRARVLRPKLGFATVHRGLARLTAVYKPAAATHAHFRCTMRGSIRDIDFTLPAQLLGGAHRAARIADRRRLDHVRRPLRRLRGLMRIAAPPEVKARVR